jgi:hypothetical protein
MPKNTSYVLHRLILSKKIIYLILIYFSQEAYGQSWITEDGEFKGWTNEVKLTFADFKGKPNNQLRNLNKEVGLLASTQVGIKTVLDVPKRKKDRGAMLEKVYVAPFFFKQNSVTLTRDPNELDKQRLYFDMAEVYARMMRREFIHLADSAKTYGTIWIMYSNIKEHYCSEYKKMFDAYTYDVFVDKKPEAYQQWRKLIDEALKETEFYQTTKADCHRLLTDKPIDPDYEQSDMVAPAFVQCR